MYMPNARVSVCTVTRPACWKELLSVNAGPQTPLEALSVDYLDLSYCTWELVVAREQDLCEGAIDAFLWGAWPRDAAADTRKQAGRQSTALTRASSCSCHVTKRFRILATLKQGNKSMYRNTSGYVHIG